MAEKTAFTFDPSALAGAAIASVTGGAVGLAAALPNLSCVHCGQKPIANDVMPTPETVVVMASRRSTDSQPLIRDSSKLKDLGGPVV